MPTVSEIKGARANAGIRWLVPAKVAVFIAMLFPLVFGVLPVTIAFAIFPGLVVLQVGL